jgi:hypothetical protein
MTTEFRRPIQFRRSSQCLVAAAAALIGASALAGEITLFQGKDFRGGAVTCKARC